MDVFQAAAIVQEKFWEYVGADAPVADVTWVMVAVMLTRRSTLSLDEVESEVRQHSEFDDAATYVPYNDNIVDEAYKVLDDYVDGRDEIDVRLWRAARDLMKNWNECV